jgi:uncharacterized protein YgiM (DUF1202 family)
MHQIQHKPTSSSSPFTRRLIGVILLVVVFAGVVVVSGRRWLTPEALQPQSSGPTDSLAFFDYTVTAEPGRVRIEGTAHLPNGVILVGTLDKMGVGPLEIKEALVMNRVFAMEFGPDLRVQYYLLGQTEALTAGIYRIGVEFDPSQQSPFAREALSRAHQAKAPSGPNEGARRIDPAIIRVVKSIAIGTPQEQRLADEHDQQYRQRVRQHLANTMHGLTGLWQRLRDHFQHERLKGAFSRADSRAQEWQQWSGQWLNELSVQGEQSRLHEVASPASPYHAVRHLLMAVHRQLPTIQDLCFEVLLGERSSNDPDIQRTEQQIHYALADAQVQLGPSEIASPPKPLEGGKATVIVTAPLVNIRSGPGMSHDSISWAKKDTVLDVLREEGEWLRVQLSEGRMGWVHRNVVSKQSSGNGPGGETTRSDVKPVLTERRVGLQLDPVALASTSVDYVPRPTADEFKIYADLEEQLRDVASRHPEERRMLEQQILQRAADKYRISPDQLWNVYLKVQGWEIRE